MQVFRHLMAISAGVVIALNYGASAIAQELSSPTEGNQSPNSSATSPENPKDFLSNSALPRVANSPQNNSGQSQPEKNKVSQSLSPDLPANNNDPNINPSGNPLLFPTKASEVKTNLVPITLEQAIATALKNNQTLQGSRLTLQRSQAELREAIGAQFPTLSTQVDFDYTDSASAELSNFSNAGSIFSSQQDTVSNSVNGNIQLSYDLYTWGRVFYTIAAAQKQVRSDQIQVEVQAEQTRFDATNDYYDLQNADAQVAIEQARVEDATQTLRDAQLLEQAGLGTRFDVLQAEVQLANANQALTRAIANQRTARRTLAETLSVGQQIDLTTADEIKEAGVWSLTLEDSIVAAYKNRGELQQQILQKEISQDRSIVALSEVRPQVNIFANYNFLDNFNDTFPVTDGYSFGARFTWNIFDGGQAAARAEQQNINAQIAETNFADQRNQIRLQVETAYYDLIANKENIGTAQKSIETATESLRLARLRFQAGVGTQTDVINSQTDLTTARGNFLSAVIDYNKALNSLQRSVSNLPDSQLFEIH